MLPLHTFTFKIVINGKDVQYQVKSPNEVFAQITAREAFPDADSITLIDIEENPIIQISKNGIL